MYREKGIGPRSRISRSIFSRRDNRLASLVFPTRSAIYRVLHGAILRSAAKHFNEIVVQAVVDLALKMPGELGLIEIAGVNGKHVGMNRHGQILQIDDHLDHAIIFARRENEQRMLVEFKVLLHSGEFTGARHVAILLRRTGAMFVPHMHASCFIAQSSATPPCGASGVAHETRA